MDTAAGWVQFRRTDPVVVIEMVRAVADSADPGEHGDGVEVVIEAPRLRWWRRLFRDWTPDQARIVVTRAAGEVSYPFSVQLVSDEGRRAARRAQRRTGTGWAASNSAGLNFLVQKGQPGQAFDWNGLVAGSISGLDALTRKLPEAGWRATVERAIKRV